MLGIALLLRVGFVLGYPQAPVAGDAAGYDAEGAALAGHGGSLLEALAREPVAKGPAYPLFLAAIYRTVGHRHMAVRLAQAVVSFLALGLLYLLGRKVFGPRVAWIVLVLATFYPPFISYPGWLWTETLSAFLVLALTLAVVAARERPRPIRWGLAGVVAGVLVLHRPEFLILVLAYGVAVGWSARRRRHATLFLAATLLTIAPWTVRNMATYGEFVLVSPQLGEVLWISSYDREWFELPREDPAYQALFGGLAPLPAQRKMLAEGVRNILRHPIGYLGMCVRRVPRFWIGGHSNTFVGLERSLGSYAREGALHKVSLKLAMLGYNLIVIVLGFAGLYLVWRLRLIDPPFLALLALPIGVKAILHTLLFATLRFQVPIMPLLILFAAVAIGHGQRALRELTP